MWLILSRRLVLVICTALLFRASSMLTALITCDGIILAMQPAPDALMFRDTLSPLGVRG